MAVGAMFFRKALFRAAQSAMKAGDYILRYSSDGSYAYEDWNADPPDDPESWGVTLLIED